MKKLIYILIGLFAFGSYAQGGPKVDVIKFRGEVTTTVRNTFDVPVGETWLIWNESNNRLEIAQSNDVWKLLLTEDLFSWPNVWTGSSNTFETNVVIGEEGVYGGGLDLIGNIPVSGFNIQFYNNDYDTPLGIVGYNTTEGLKLENNTSSKSLKLLDSGLLTYNGQMTVSDDAYDATDWNGNLEVPTKNAVRDKIESMGSGGTIDTSITDGSTNAVENNAIFDALALKADASAIPTVINNLTSTSTTAALSAAQGKVLQDGKAGLASSNTFTNENIFTSITKIQNAGVYSPLFFKSATSNLLNQAVTSGSSIQFNSLGQLYVALANKTTGPNAYHDWQIATNNTGTRTYTFQDASGTVAFLSDISGGGTDDQTAAEVPFTPYSTIAATNVQDAIEELLDESASGPTLINSDTFVGATTANVNSATATKNYIDAAVASASGIKSHPDSPVVIDSLYVGTVAQIAAAGLGSDVLSIPTDASPAEVVASATITMDGFKMYDDQSTDAGTITLSDCDPGETLIVYINRASAPTLAGSGLTFNALPNTTVFASATQMGISFMVAYDGATIDYYYFER